MSISNHAFTAYTTSLSVNFLNTIQMHQHKVIDLLQNNSAVTQWGQKMVDVNILKPIQFNRIFTNGSFQLESIDDFRNKYRGILENLDQHAGDTANEIATTYFEEKIKAAPLWFRLIDNQLVAIPQKGGTVGLLSLLSYDFIKLHETGEFERIKNCANKECLAFFIDHSGRRKWCSMQECGNRNKVKKFESKQKML